MNTPAATSASPAPQAAPDESTPTLDAGYEAAEKRAALTPSTKTTPAVAWDDADERDKARHRAGV